MHTPTETCPVQPDSFVIVLVPTVCAYLVLLQLYSPRIAFSSVGFLGPGAVHLGFRKPFLPAEAGASPACDWMSATS